MSLSQEAQMEEVDEDNSDDDDDDESRGQGYRIKCHKKKWG